MAVMDHSFDVLIIKFGLIRRVYCNVSLFSIRDYFSQFSLPQFSRNNAKLFYIRAWSFGMLFLQIALWLDPGAFLEYSCVIILVEYRREKANGTMEVPEGSATFVDSQMATRRWPHNFQPHHHHPNATRAGFVRWKYRWADQIHCKHYFHLSGLYNTET